MINHSSWLLAVALMLAVSAGAGQAQQPPAPDVSTLGPQPGQRVPDFSLPDQRGARRTLQSLMGAKGLILVFNRSVDW